MENKKFSAADILSGARMILHDLSIPELYEEALTNKEAILAKSGALCIYTGKYTGRSPKDRFIVDTPSVHNLVSWSNNVPCTEETFQHLYSKMKSFAKNHKLYVSDNYVGADPEHKLQVKCITESAAQHLFLKELFIRPKEPPVTPEDFTLICCPSVKANPLKDAVHSEAFIIINFDYKMVLIGGTKYSGEMKKSIFSVMNFILPQKGILSMHCSANVGKDGKTAIFFGLSGTGKTTLSADPNRSLIGDDEHGWSEHGIFNIEGGCYAKCIHLSEETEPEIYNAIKYGAVLENVVLEPKTRKEDYDDTKYTENTRVAYPLEYIPNAIHPSIAGHPTAIIFLTADAFGVLPPISKLNPKQAMYHFLSGYTSKVAGTERGIVEPQATFSIGFGEPFLPLSPLKYARLLEQKIKKYDTKVYLVNTGWTGGPYGIGSRMKLKYTRAMITAALEGQLDNVTWTSDPIFKVAVPDYCPNVPSDVLEPANTWSDKAAYKKQAAKLVGLFAKNVKKFKGEMADDILSTGPSL
ncbi:phosphoenolpyruvate carboxykinase (ATP) [Pectinatus cerevisiiphilus]|uniref:Phosphoenolpyruvate carboxykinase (ATP) n=1 Tax=Pectinatus cerevisiiphilus TaxID=86956 RepID=A0A4R3K9Q6_9FIRM|nr:phosphoenolpyruvate carboxykinase (ATP) [Pectinatus cerevisiiphilus]TCS79697.1 phosphoenolpyruvate carboxykinase (ATP) [Pectinatus cerevisiiphilus]